MAVIIGSARINEKGTISGGKAGDQTGNEVGKQNWYLHSKGWVVIRPKSMTDAEKIAHNMESICDNNNIGYCQDHRTSLTNLAKPYGYDASKVKQLCEVDCSEAVRNCCLYAGISVGSFNTASQVNTLKATGKFDIITDDKTCKVSDYLRRGDILVTKTKGHTVVVLTNGSKVSSIFTVNVKKTIDEIVQEVIDGKWGSGENRKNQLTKAGYDYNEIQKKVNQILTSKNISVTANSSKGGTKSIDEIAREVLSGKWGSGESRRKNLAAAGYDYAKVQARVNQLSGK